MKWWLHHFGKMKWQTLVIGCAVVQIARGIMTGNIGTIDSGLVMCCIYAAIIAIKENKRDDKY